MKTIQKFKQTKFIEAVTVEKQIILLKWKAPCDSRERLLYRIEFYENLHYIIKNVTVCVFET